MAIISQAPISFRPNLASAARATTDRRIWHGQERRPGRRVSPLPVLIRMRPRVAGSGIWVVVPPNVSELALDAGNPRSAKQGALQTRTDFGKPGYGGPCPP